MASLPQNSVAVATGNDHHLEGRTLILFGQRVNRFRHALDVPMRRRVQVAGVASSLARGVVAGAAGTAAMTGTALLRRAVHARRRGIRIGEIDEILDYDDSEHVVIAASSVLGPVLGRRPRTPAQRRAVFALVHWGYGSAVGAGHVGLRRLLGREPAAGLAFFVACETMALGLFPVLGDTPVPWRWRRDLLVTSLAQHGVYAATVAAAGAALRED